MTTFAALRKNEVSASFAIQRLRAGLSGSVVLPGDPSYDDDRKVWNGMVDKKPAVIIFCRRPSDVIQALEFAKSENAAVSVRAGGHNIAGCSV